MENKMKVVKVETPRGEMTLKFRPVLISSDEPDEQKKRLENGFVCTQDCSYREICKYLYDPRTEDKSGEFIDFCNNLVDNDTSLCEMVPMEGTLEDNIEDIDDIYKQAGIRNPYIRLNDVVDKVCPTLLCCPHYDKEHSSCMREKNNYTCLLNYLLMKNEESNNE